MRILLVEDDLDLAGVITRLLTGNGYAVDHAPNRRRGEALISDNIYDLMILDRKLPDGDGVDLCTSVREEGIRTPVLILTTVGVVASRVEGLNAGADDYLTKPFDSGELIARVQALIRRGASQPNPQLQIADLTINQANRTVARGGTPILLTAKEFSILEYLALNRRRVLTRETIAEHAWDMHFEPRSNVVDAYISVLRKKIDRGFHPTLIHTVKGVGYRFDDNP